MRSGGDCECNEYELLSKPPFLKLMVFVVLWKRIMFFLLNSRFFLFSFTRNYFIESKLAGFAQMYFGNHCSFFLCLGRFCNRASTSLKIAGLRHESSGWSSSTIHHDVKEAGVSCLPGTLVKSSNSCCRPQMISLFDFESVLITFLTQTSS